MMKSQRYYINLRCAFFLIGTLFFQSNAYSQTSALYFDGDNDYATTNISLPNDYTFEFYLKFHDLSILWQTIFNFNEGDWEPWFGTDNGPGIDDKLEFWDYGSYLFRTDSVLSEDVWYHIALVKHGTNIYIYLEGERIFIHNGETTAPNGPFSIGGQETAYSGNMTIDELRISSIARYTDDFYQTSDCEFSADSDTYALYHFNDGSPSQFATDDSGNGHDLRLGTSVNVDGSDPEWIIDGIVPIEVEIIGNTSFCQTASEATYTSQVSNNVLEYIWEINGDLEIISGQGTSSVTIRPTLDGNAGVAEICLTVDAGCGLNIVDCQLIEIQAVEEIALTDLPGQTFCESDDSVSLGVTQDNQVGVWAGPGVNNNQFYPELAGAGTHELIFSLDNVDCAIGVFPIEVFECDCTGTPNGSALIDGCGECLEPSDPNFDSCLDCAGVPDGGSVIDDCGECLEPSNPNFNACFDCAGIANGNAEIDDCGECLEPSDLNFNGCVDCAGVPNGTSVIDDCGECLELSHLGFNTCLDVLNPPEFFTPNDDGYHDFWQVGGITNFPDSKTLIFNRFGKLLATLSPNELGWDGLYNGKKMEASDYWFRIDIGDGRSLSGHFALRR